MTPTPSQPNASPQPILPGVPVPSSFPCWAWCKLCEQWHYIEVTQYWVPELYSHYLLAPAAADPVTFPKAETRSAICYICKEPYDKPGNINCSAVHAPPSAGTEQKERGEQPLNSGTQKGGGIIATHIPCATGSPAAPTGGTTTPLETPRTDAMCREISSLPSSFGAQRRRHYLKFARTLERELNATKAETNFAWRDKYAEQSARLALTEKLLGEAQGERDKLKEIECQSWNFSGIVDRLEREMRQRFSRGQPEGAEPILDELRALLHSDQYKEHYAVKEFLWACKRHEDEVVSLRAQLATSQARLVEVEKERDGFQQRIFELLREGDSIRSALAQAKQDNQELQIKLGASAMFGALGGRLMTHIFDAADMSLEEATDVELQLVRLLGELKSLRAANTALQEQLTTILTGNEEGGVPWLNNRIGEICLLNTALSAQVEELKRDKGLLTTEIARLHGLLHGTEYVARAHAKQSRQENDVLPPKKKSFPPINTFSGGEAPGSLLDA